MRVDLQSPDSWEQINQSYRDALALGEGGYQVQTFLGLKHAVWEIATQLTQLFPNKRTVAYAKDSFAIFETVAVALSREGFTVKPLTADDLRAPSSWLDPVLKDLLFVLHSEDDPVTGELRDVPELDDALKEKRVYRISISHSRHACLGWRKPLALEARLHSLRVDRCVALVGERVKVMPPVASSLSWPTMGIAEARAQTASLDSAHYEALRLRVEGFERDLPAGAVRIIAEGTPRLYDRTLFAFNDVDGLAFISELARELGVDLRRPGEHGALETTSLCRWHDERALKGLHGRGIEADLLRGLAIIAAESVVADLRVKVSRAHERLTKRQSG